MGVLSSVMQGWGLLTGHKAPEPQREGPDAAARSGEASALVSDADLVSKKARMVERVSIPEYGRREELEGTSKENASVLSPAASPISRPTTWGSNLQFAFERSPEAAADYLWLEKRSITQYSFANDPVTPEQEVEIVAGWRRKYQESVRELESLFRTEEELDAYESRWKYLENRHVVYKEFAALELDLPGDPASALYGELETRFRALAETDPRRYEPLVQIASDARRLCQREEEAELHEEWER